MGWEVNNSSDAAQDPEPQSRAAEAATPPPTVDGTAARRRKNKPLPISPKKAASEEKGSDYPPCLGLSASESPRLPSLLALPAPLAV